MLIGRAYLWGLAANGTAGVENVLDILRGGIDATMRGIGVGSIHDLSPEHVIVPDGFSPPAIGLIRSIEACTVHVSWTRSQRSPLGIDVIDPEHDGAEAFVLAIVGPAVVFDVGPDDHRVVGVHESVVASGQREVARVVETLPHRVERGRPVAHATVGAHDREVGVEHGFETGEVVGGDRAEEVRLEELVELVDFGHPCIRHGANLAEPVLLLA